MKIYLDDIRNCSYGDVKDHWLVVRSFREVISWLESGEVTELSLDHDLGTRKTGYDVLLWIERKVVKEGFVPPKLFVHTANPSAERKMYLAIKSIEDKAKEYRIQQKANEYVKETLPLIAKDKRGRFLKEI